MLDFSEISLIERFRIITIVSRDFGIHAFQKLFIFRTAFKFSVRFRLCDSDFLSSKQEFAFELSDVSKHAQHHLTHWNGGVQIEIEYFQRHSSCRKQFLNL